MRMGSVESAVAENLEGVMRDGPRLHYGLRSAIACRGNGKILKVGLGAMGVGQMVFSDEGYTDKPEFIVTMILSTLLILPFGLTCSTYIAKCLVVKKKYLMPTVAVLAITGASIGYGEVYYVWVAIVFGIFGYVCEKAGFSTLAIAMALILGPIIEVNLRSSLMLPDAGIMLFLTRPISLLFIVMAVLTVIFGVRRETKIRGAEASRAAHA